MVGVVVLAALAAAYIVCLFVAIFRQSRPFSVAAVACAFATFLLELVQAKWIAVAIWAAITIYAAWLLRRHLRTGTSR
jgi:membrane protein DedA with SNARE-associated domain